MITAVEIENFKGIRERTRIEIKPITLLFGPNSAGKSTLLHALQLAREVFTRRNLDVDVTDGGAGFIDLGGFRNYVHGRDPDKVVTLRFELDLSSTNFLTEYPIPEYLIPIPGRGADETRDVSTIGDDIRHGWVEIELRLCPHTRTVYISAYDVGLDGDFFAGLCASPRYSKGKGVTVEDNAGVSHLNIHHPLLRWNNPRHGSFGVLDALMPGCQYMAAQRFRRGEIIAREELSEIEKQAIVLPVGIDEGPEPWILSRFLGWSGVSEDREPRCIFASPPDGSQVRLWGVEYPRPAWNLKEARRHVETDPGIQEWLISGNADAVGRVSLLSHELWFENVRAHALPDLGWELEFDAETIGDLLDGGIADSPEEEQKATVFAKLLGRLLLVPGRVLRSALSEFRYVGPVRDAVPRNFSPPRFPDSRRWAGGLAAWDKLAHAPDSVVTEVSDWLGDEDRLNTGYGVQVERFREVPMDHPLSYALEGLHLFSTEDEDSLKKLFRELPEKRRVMLIALSNMKAMHPLDVGQGITQAVPVIVAALSPFAEGESPRGGLVAIEQPELHLNPRQQAALGDVFLTSALHSPRNRFILETHSEHLILRLQRRIREATARRDDAQPTRVKGKPAEHLPPPEERASSDDPLKLDVRDIDVGVYYVRSTEGRTLFGEMPLDLAGDFRLPWPDDFFEIDFHERFGE